LEKEVLQMKDLTGDHESEINSLVSEIEAVSKEMEVSLVLMENETLILEYHKIIMCDRQSESK